MTLVFVLDSTRDRRAGSGIPIDQSARRRTSYPVAAPKRHVAGGVRRVVVQQARLLEARADSCIEVCRENAAGTDAEQWPAFGGVLIRVHRPPRAVGRKAIDIVAVALRETP